MLSLSGKVFSAALVVGFKIGHFLDATQTARRGYFLLKCRGPSTACFVVLITPGFALQATGTIIPRQGTGLTMRTPIITPYRELTGNISGRRRALKVLARVRLKYVADTTGGTSGSPVKTVWGDYPRVTIGIHTWQGCEDPDIGYNHGTGFRNDYIRDFLNAASPDNTVYVDNRHPSIMLENGMVWSPYGTVLEAVSMSEPDDTLCIAAGSYNETMTIDKQLTLSAVGGNVTIGR